MTEKGFKKVLVVSDFPAGTLGGAQSILQVIQGLGERIKIENAIYPQPKESFVGNIQGRFRRGVKSIINPRGIMKLTWKIIRIRPDVIWFHNINNLWSWSSLLIPAFGAKKIITLHDLTILSNYKITINSEWNSKSLNTKKLTLWKKIRLWYVKKTLSKAKTVGIGRLCVELLRINGVRVDFVIPNRIEPCAHENKQLKRPKTILFAGRLNLKGLNVVAKSVSLCKDWTLIIAGHDEAFAEAQKYCERAKIDFRGFLPREKLLELIHEVELVAVCSQYYDNYPTIGLEALVHGSLPLTTNLTGISTLMEQISKELVIECGEIPVLDAVKPLSFTQEKTKESLISEITDLSAFVTEYLEVMK